MERFGVGRAEALNFASNAKLASAKRSTNGLKWNVYARSFGVQFEPRYIFRAGRLDQ